MTRLLLRVALIVVGCFIACGAIELGLRAQQAHVSAANHVSRGVDELYMLTTAPQRYELRPNVRRYRGRIDINSLGLRGPEIPAARGAGEFRVLFVGDSVTFAGEWRYESGFAPKAAAALGGDRQLHFANVRGLNGGVPGYSPYNELYWLREKGALLQPDAVVIQFCLNDVVDPLPQWNLMLGDAITADLVPDEAVPNPAAHRRLLRLQTLRRFRLFTVLENAWTHEVTVEGRPAYLTEEQPLSIEVYSHPNAPEIRWLRRMYAQLVAEAKRLTPTVAILFVPLAYELEPDYPVQSPREVMRSIAQENHVPMIDLTPPLGVVGPQRAFRLGSPGSHDIWHLSEEGHDIAAREIAASLEQLVSDPSRRAVAH